jgi:vanillate O-demethylase monooxygenase subunit
VLLNDYVCLYRAGDGAVVALENRCPHRNLPLSAGNLVGDSVQCAYHGLVIARDGKCIHVPGQDEVPDWACVRRYPVVEQGGWVFIWMGEPALADEAQVPDYHRRVTDPGWVAVTGQSHVKAGYRLVLDNLLDLSHLTYVHGSTTGNAAVAESADIATEMDGDSVRVTRVMSDIEPATAFVEYGGYAGNIDRWQVSQFLPPAYIDINNGSNMSGAGARGAERNVSQGHWGFVVYHAMTPETETTTHQFWCVAADKNNVAPNKRAQFAEQMHGVLGEDLDVYEAQQRCIDLDPEAIDRDANPRGTIPADKGLLAMRRVIRRLYSVEQQQAIAAE